AGHGGTINATTASVGRILRAFNRKLNEVDAQPFAIKTLSDVKRLGELISYALLDVGPICTTCRVPHHRHVTECNGKERARSCGGSCQSGNKSPDRRLRTVTLFANREHLT